MKKIILGFLLVILLATNAQADHIEKMFPQKVLDYAPTFADCAGIFHIHRELTEDKIKKKEILRIGRLNYKTSVYLFAVEGWLKGDRPADREKAEIKTEKIVQKKLHDLQKVFATHGQKGKDFFNKVLGYCNKNQVAREFYLPKLESIMEDTIIIQSGDKAPVYIPVGSNRFGKQ